MTARSCGWGSLALLGAYVTVLAWSNGSVTGISRVQPFDLGALEHRSAALQSISLLLGLAFGWGVPGVSLALLFAPELRGARLLSRSLGFGIGYVFLTGLGWASMTGHAPDRLTLLVATAAPSVWLVIRSRADDRVRRETTVVAPLVAMMLIAGLLWPKVRYEALSGDGTEVYELSRSLDASPLPKWEMETDRDRFGTPATVPYFTGAYLAHGVMTLLGKSEVAVRLPFVSSLVVVAVTALGLVTTRRRVDWLYAAGVGAVYLVWNAYFVGYEAPIDLAEPAGTDALTIALWLAGFAELIGGSLTLGVVFLVLASGTTHAATVLSVFALAALWWFDRDRGRAALARATIAAALVVPVVLMFAWRSGDLQDWVRQFQSEYWEDLVAPGRRVAALPLVGQLLLMTGLLPLLIPLFRSRLSLASRVLSVTAVAYLAVVLAGSYKNLHYLMPLPWLLLPAAIEAASPGFRVLAASSLAGVLALSWPIERAIRREPIALGLQTCIQGLPYEVAAMRLSGLYDALDWPATGRRFGVGKHTFVRYGVELGGADCVLGLSMTAPPGAIVLVEGPPALWTTDPNRYAGWRLRAQMPMPSSSIFPRLRVDPPAGSDPATWPRRVRVVESAGRSLLISGFGSGEGETVEVRESARLLVPLAGNHSSIGLRIHSARETMIRVVINGIPAPDVRIEPEVAEVMVAGAWRTGWNVLEMGGAAGTRLEWVDRGSRIPERQ